MQPGFIYSAADEVDILTGALISFGERTRVDGAVYVPEDLGNLSNIEVEIYNEPRSEFGSYPHFFYVEMKAYF